MCILCGQPGLVHESGLGFDIGFDPGVFQAVSGEAGGDEGSPGNMPLPNLNETTDAAGGTSTSYTVGVGQTLQGVLSSNSDHDWYKVTLTAGQTYTFAMVGTGTNNVIDPYLRLYASDGATILKQDDDSLPGGNSIFTYTATTSGTFYLDAASYNNSGSGQYGVSITAGTKAFFDIVMGAGVIDTDSSWSAPGVAATVTYGFRQSAASYTVTGSNIATFTQFSAAEMAAVQTILQLWSEVANVSFTQVNPGGYTNNASILFGNYVDNDGAGAFAFYPGSTAATSSAGDVWANLNSVSTTSLPVGSYSFFALMHEVGHTLGLSHPGLYNAAPGVSITYTQNAQFIQDSQQYSVMSYFDESSTGGNAGGYPDTPMMFDIYALQQIYGVNMSTRVGNTTYGFGSNAGSIYDFSVNTLPGLCIWDAGGTDTLNCSGYGQAQLINLNPGTFSNIGGLTANVSIALGATIEIAIGGSGADTLIASDAGSTLIGGGGNDTLTGGIGNDTFDGGIGADSITTGGGDNTVIFRTGSGADTVNGFVAGGAIDRIDLTSITSVHNLNEVLALATQIGANTVINFGGGDTITLVGVTRANLTANDFVFASSTTNTAPTINSNGGGTTAALSVAENSTAVTTVAATDPDAGTTLTYSIVGGSDQAKFQINATTGVLSFVSAPNFEAPTDSDGNNSYIVQVQVSDGSLTDAQTITVSVTNVNESPSITSNGGAATATVSAAENSTAVTTVAASDPDAGTTLSYSIVGGSDQARFQINAATGALSFIAAPDYEAPSDSDQNNSYVVQVRASDGSLSSTQTLTVNVTNVNEAPAINSNGGGATAALSIVESTTAVTTVTAVDPDSGTTLTYSIVGGADQAKFQINSTTGALSFIAAPSYGAPADFDHNNSYIVQVRASDGSLSSTQTLTVNVTSAASVITGDNAANTLNGTGGSDLILGLGGNDILNGLGGNDTLNGGAGFDTLTGGTGADKFVFDAAALADAQATTPIYDRIVDFNQSGGSFNIGEGDQVDLSALLSNAYAHGAGQSVGSLVALVEDAGNGFAYLAIDPDGVAGSAGWTTIARLDGLHLGNSISVILDSTLPGGSTISATSFITTTATSPDGSFTVYNHDLANIYGWTSENDYFDNQGRQTGATITNDDGTRQVYSFDVANQYNWSNYVITYDAQGRQISEVDRYDDGSGAVGYLDPSNQYNWSSYYISTDSLGRPTLEIDHYDDGTTATGFWDVANQYDWSSQSVSYDAQGRALTQTINYDNGSHMIYSWDPADKFAWSSVVSSYDASWNLLEQVGTYDNGATWHI